MLKIRYAFLSLAALSLGAPTLGSAQSFEASLNGYQESPSVSTNATGRFDADLDQEAGQLSYTLSYENISTNVSFAHIHFAQQGVNGGVVVWLCDNTGNGPENTQACPQGSGTVEGIISSADVVGPEDKGIAAGEFSELVSAMDADATYVNVHTETFNAGEIRGQIGRKVEVTP